ncbi:MAG: GNAT family N-acetyltransferase [Bacteroidota bacterium]
MTNFSFHIRRGSIEEAVALSRQLPEFAGPHGEAEYHRRLDHCRHLVLIAYKDTQAIGFKVGYEREDYFYSWMGGVLPAYRQRGVAAALAREQQDWARAEGFTAVQFKTRNRLKAMLLFGLRSGFDIIGFEPREQACEHRILLRKPL